MVYSDTAGMGEMWNVCGINIWSFVYFHFEALCDAFEVEFFSGLKKITHIISKTVSACMRAMQFKIFKSGNIVKQCL